ncbi:MAG: tyrosine-type recombinase/integrase [Firmicutes bacterium]|nr:tyrosine-type recombinase/integrase [Bacillota bacterium]
MRGYITKRSKNSWTIVLTVGRKVDPKTGKSRPDQKWITVRGTKKEAEAKLAELLHQYNRGELVEPTKMTVGEWLIRWLDVYVTNSSKKKFRTQETYASIVRNHLIPALGHIRLQKLQPADIQAYYNNSGLSSSTLEQHHAVLHQALKVAMQNERLINVNPAAMVAEKPKGKKNLDMQVWSEEEVRRFLSAARKRGTQCEAFYTMALETGMRKGELCGLKWEDVDLENLTISVRRTLIKAGPDPVMGTPKTGRGRAIAISPALARLLARHKAEQESAAPQAGCTVP